MVFFSQVAPMPTPTTRAAPAARTAMVGVDRWPVVIVLMSWSFAVGPVPPAFDWRRTQNDVVSGGACQPATSHRRTPAGELLSQKSPTAQARFCVLVM